MHVIEEFYGDGQGGNALLAGVYGIRVEDGYLLVDEILGAA